MAACRKVHKISTKYLICINWRHYVIYLQNMKFVQLILWPGGAYTDNTYATKPESRSHIMIHFMNHDYIGSFWQCQMSQKSNFTAKFSSVMTFFLVRSKPIWVKYQEEYLQLQCINEFHKYACNPGKLNLLQVSYFAVTRPDRRVSFNS